MYFLHWFSDWTQKKSIIDCHCPFNLYSVLSGTKYIRTILNSFRLYFDSFSLLTFVDIFWQVPLFCIKSPESVDPFYHMRVTWASNRGIVLTFDQNVDWYSRRSDCLYKVQFIELIFSKKKILLCLKNFQWIWNHACCWISKYFAAVDLF